MRVLAGLSEKELKKLRSKQRREQARQAATKEEAKPKGVCCEWYR